MRSKRSRLLYPGCIAVLFCGALLGSTPASAQSSVYSDSLFELGDAEAPPGFPGMGNVLLSVTQGGPDWEDVFDADGAWRDDDANGVPDFQEVHGGTWAVFSADDVSQGSGFESTALAGDGRIYNGTAAGDHDLGNSYAYTTTDGLGNVVLYAAAERLGGGDSSLEFEFNHDHFTLGRGGYGKGEPWEVVGSRVVGDVLVKLSFSAGALGLVEASNWDGTGWVLLESFTGEGCNAAETFCAICNAGDIDGGPWPNFDATGDPEQLSGGRFVEFGINLGVLLGAQPDFTTARLRTPQDAAFAYFAEGN